MRRIIIALLLIILSIGVVTYLVKNKPEPPKKKPVVQSIIVETKPVVIEDIQFSIGTQGPVNPLITSDIVAEVSGRIIHVSKNFRVGSFVKKGELLFEVDPGNYLASLRSAEASLAQAKASYQSAKALSDQARKDWNKIGRGKANDLVLKIPQLNQAKASVQSAEANLLRAKRDFTRTKVTASFDALVKSKNVDLGQYVNMGSNAGTLFGTGLAEVRLPIPDQDLAYIQLPKQGDQSTHAKVRLMGTFAGKQHEWFGKVVRTEGVVDQKNRLTYLVAQVSDPYGLKKARDIPLRFGTFVKAEIDGIIGTDLIALPRQALYENNKVLTMVKENEILIKSVTVAKSDKNTVYIDSGLSESDKIIITPIETPVNGMKVQLVGVAAKKQESQPSKEPEATETLPEATSGN